MYEYTAVEAFWKRYNKVRGKTANDPLLDIAHSYHQVSESVSYYLQVLLDKHALEKERQTLDTENQKLRALLKQYLDGELVHCIACIGLSQ